MNFFLPNAVMSLICFIIIIAVLEVAGYLIINKLKAPSSRWSAWIITIFFVTAINIITWHDPPFFRMLAIICTLFLGMKIIVANEYYMTGTLKHPGKFMWIAYSLFWVGMNPSVFSKKGTTGTRKAKKMIIFGSTRLLLGVLIIVFAKWIYHNTSIIPMWAALVTCTLLLLVGLSQFLHFGLLSLNAGLWRLVGYPAYYLFRKPLTSQSLQEFWGRRWNIAFSEMTSIAIYRPLAKMSSKNIALIAAFFFSGILHELAISLPVNNGYGMPLLYFLIQGVGQLLEKRINFSNMFIRRSWVMIWLILPLPLLFHYHFLNEIIWPLIGLHFN